MVKRDEADFKTFDTISKYLRLSYNHYGSIVPLCKTKLLFSCEKS